ncbi:MAG: hypothetical protein ACX94C_14035 [Phycisphaerales bacterium]
MRTPTITIVFVLIFLTAGITGCTDLQGAITKASAWRDEAQTIQGTLDEQAGSLRTQLAALDPDSPEARQLDTDISLLDAKRAALSAAIARANLVLEEAHNPSDSLTVLARGVSSWVPAPVQGPLVLGAALLASLARSRKLKQSSASIVDSIAHVLERDEAFRSLFDAHADTVRSIQTPGARKLVDQTQRRRALVAR